MKLYVPFSEIPEHGVECEIKDSSWFPGELGEPAGPVSIHVRLVKKNENRVELKGELQASVSLECDRCLEKFICDVESPMRLVIEVAEKGEHWRMRDLEATGTELETVSQEKPIVDLAELFRQQLLLSLPGKRLCSDTCSGLCQRCGANLNHGNCGCEELAGSSPFAVLKALKKK